MADPSTSPDPFPRGPIRRHRGRGVAVIGADIDTDRIIPARYLKCVTFDDLAEGVFADDRAERRGQAGPLHPFDRAEHRGASVLVVNRNFGCGSSREHAPQALMRWGIRVLIGESFAEIFFGNCLALGLPCLSAPAEVVGGLQEALGEDPAACLDVDVEGLTVQLISPEDAACGRWQLALNPGAHSMLVSGQWDGTSQLLAHRPQIQQMVDRLPYLNRFAQA